jgi:hypothetical protein
MGGLRRLSSRRGSGLSRENYEKRQAPLLINIIRSVFSASAPTITVVICDSSDVAARALRAQRRFCRQRDMEAQPAAAPVASRYELDARDRAKRTE